MWKGDRVGRDELHNWVRRWLPRPRFCQDCKKEKKLDLANISQRYLRNLTDWEYICRRCHMLKDGRIEQLKKYSNYVGSPNDRRGRKNKIKDDIRQEKMDIEHQDLMRCESVAVEEQDGE
jgi:hypothetical protein